jgi:hypothetical protein
MKKPGSEERMDAIEGLIEGFGNTQTDPTHQRCASFSIEDVTPAGLQGSGIREWEVDTVMLDDLDNPIIISKVGPTVGTPTATP